MRNFIERWLGLTILLVCGNGLAQPPLPSQWFYFPSDFTTVFGDAPRAYTTNLISTPMSVDMDPFDASALILDTTNLTPAFLNYDVIDTNGPDIHRNINYGNGTALWYFAPNWASVSQGGTGPGETAYFIAGGDFTTNAPDGLFAIYADAGGSNIYFGGERAGDVEVYASAPISWTSNVFHQLGFEWTSSDCEIYLDGALAATGNGVMYVPARSTWTNGWYLGSDSAGFEQSRGAFWSLITWNLEDGGLYTNGWSDLSNSIVAWQATLGGGGFGGMMGMGGLGSLNPTNNSCGCISNASVHLTNMAAAGAGGPDITFTFTIEGGIMGIPYDIFTTSNLLGSPATNSVWTWLGQGTNCGTYFVINQAATASFYILGGPNLASDGSGFTAAYEQLVASDGFGTPNAWYLAQGLNPQTPGIGTQDLNGSGLSNWQDYLYGSNPQGSGTFSVWVGEPSGTSGIP